MSRRSKTLTEPCRRVELTRIGHGVTVQPACPDVLCHLRGVEHVLASNCGKGCHLEAVVRTQYGVAGIGGASDKSTAEAPIGITMVGLLPAVRRLLQDHGYRVEGPPAVASLLGPFSAPLDALQVRPGWWGLIMGREGVVG